MLFLKDINGCEDEINSTENLTNTRTYTSDDFFVLNSRRWKN